MLLSELHWGLPECRYSECGVVEFDKIDGALSNCDCNSNWISRAPLRYIGLSETPVQQQVVDDLKPACYQERRTE